MMIGTAWGRSRLAKKKKRPSPRSVVPRADLNIALGGEGGTSLINKPPVGWAFISQTPEGDFPRKATHVSTIANADAR